MQKLSEIESFKAFLLRVCVVLDVGTTPIALSHLDNCQFL
jgi:hypothetical protein